MATMGPWSPFVFRRRGQRARYELCLAGNDAVNVWHLAGVLPRDPRAPRVAELTTTAPIADLWREGTGDDGQPVLVWDAGRFRCEGSLEDGIRRGKLRVELQGYKLFGTWALGRQKGTWRGRGRWDLSSAWDVTAVPSSAPTHHITDHSSLLSGLGASDIDGSERRELIASLLAEHRARRGAVPWRDARRIAPALPAAPFTDPAWLFELRRGGDRVLAVRHRKRGHIIDVAGNDISEAAPLVCRALAALPISPAVIEGELVFDDFDRPTLWAFDLLAAAGRDTRGLTTVARKEVIAALLGPSRIVRFVDHLDAHGEALCERLESEGDPSGVVARRKDARLEPVNDSSERIIRGVDSASRRPAPRPSSRPRVRTSNRDKVFWPDSGLTKGDLLDYYEAIAPTLLAYLADRPLVLTRFPDGIGGRSFFQHHAPGAKSAWLRTVRIKTSRRWRDYFICESAADLLYLINLGTIELHGWPCRSTSLEKPDWCTIDIDRSDASFADVVAVALATRDLCDSVGLPAWVKTSGGDGLHVVIPLAGKLEWDGARMLAELLARTLVGERGDIATIEPSIARRGGRVYVDYLVNARGRMLAVPYGARARPGAPVSTPLSWSEVSSSLTPGEHNIETVAARVAAGGDPWRSIFESEVDIPAVLDRLARRLGPG